MDPATQPRLAGDGSITPEDLGAWRTQTRAHIPLQFESGEPGVRHGQ